MPKVMTKETKEMKRKKPVFEYAIICDDIRHEMGNKFSLIGIYGSELQAAQLPFLFGRRQRNDYGQ